MRECGQIIARLKRQNYIQSLNTVTYSKFSHTYRET